MNRVRVKRSSETPRMDSWTRIKRFEEKWPRLAAEVPPEIAEEIDRYRKNKLDPVSRAEIVRAGLRLYMEKYLPEPEPAVEGEAEDAPPEIGEAA